MTRYKEELTPYLLAFAAETKNDYKNLINSLDRSKRNGTSFLRHLPNEVLEDIRRAMRRYEGMMFDIYPDKRKRLFREAKYHDALLFIRYLLPLLDEELTNRSTPPA